MHHSITWTIPQILGIVERNASYNDVLYEEFFFENCVTKSTSNLLDYYEQVEFCASTTHQEIAYFPIVRVANRNFTSPLTGALIEAGSVQVGYTV